MTIMIEPHFAEPILSGRKIHTIRQNYPHWAKHDGKECSIRVWEGKPYRSRQREICRKTIGVEKCMFKRSLFAESPKTFGCFTFVRVFDNNLYIKRPPLDALADNDGLTEREFIDYFKDYPEGRLAILHFTDFRYGKGETR